MSFLDSLARLADDLGLGTYTPDAIGGTIFLLELPDSPDLAMAFAGYGGTEGNAKYGWDEPNFQVRVRGPQSNSRAAADKAQDVYDQLHGLGGRTLTDGTHLLLVTGVQSGPVYAGRDANSRPEFVINFRAQTERTTPNRQ